MKEGIILAGGKGSRLGSTEEYPKPMVRVAGKPILEWIIRGLVNKGIRRLVIATGVGEGAVKEFFGDGGRFGCDILYCHSRDGTGIALIKAIELLDAEDSFLVANGDTYCEWDIGEMNTNGNRINVVVGYSNQEGEHTWLDGEGKIWYDYKKPLIGQKQAQAGVWAFPWRFRWNGELPQSMEEVLKGKNGKLIKAKGGQFWDIGTPDRLVKAQKELQWLLPSRFFQWEAMSLERGLAQERERQGGPLAELAGEITTTLSSGKKVMVIGNGGSYADALHFAAELTSRLEKERDHKGYRVMALGDAVYFTGRVNDSEGVDLFDRQVGIWGEEGDLLLCLSTSGESRNVVLAAERGIREKMRVWAITKEGSTLAWMLPRSVLLGDWGTQRIQEMTMNFLHTVCELVATR